jgi:predicted phosphodiesterase
MIAILYDVHGNLAALEAVRDDALAAGADLFILGGDYALFGPHPVETVAALQALPGALWIRGNGERWTADPAAAPENEVVPGAIAACRDALGPQLVDELAALPTSLTRAGIRFDHGSPVSDVRSFPPTPDDGDAELLGDATARRFVFGHTHLQFQRPGPDGIELTNPGSVGMPFDGDLRAAYALLGDGGSIEFRRVQYDHVGAAADVCAAFGEHEWTDVIARRIATARM